MRYTLISEWCLLLPASYILVTLEWVPDGLLAAWAVAPALTLILMQRRFRGGRWQSSAQHGSAGLFSVAPTGAPR
jgi:Na+-driven multidrug efflux pump